MAGLPPQSPMYSEVSESALSGEDTSQFLVAKKVLCGITVTTILKGIKSFVIYRRLQVIMFVKKQFRVNSRLSPD